MNMMKNITISIIVEWHLHVLGLFTVLKIYSNN